MRLPASYLKIRPTQIKYDAVFNRVLKRLVKSPDSPFLLTQEQKDELATQASLIDKVTRKLNRRQLDDTSRALLSHSDLYQYLLHKSIFAEPEKAEGEVFHECDLPGVVRVGAGINSLYASSATLYAFMKSFTASQLNTRWVREGSGVWAAFKKAATKLNALDGLKDIGIERNGEIKGFTPSKVLESMKKAGPILIVRSADESYLMHCMSGERKGNRLTEDSTYVHLIRSDGTLFRKKFSDFKHNWSDALPFNYKG